MLTKLERMLSDGVSQEEYYRAFTPENIEEILAELRQARKENAELRAKSEEYLHEWMRYEKFKNLRNLRDEYEEDEE